MREGERETLKVAKELYELAFGLNPKDNRAKVTAIKNKLLNQNWVVRRFDLELDWLYLSKIVYKNWAVRKFDLELKWLYLSVFVV